jgi:hypothetical protein
MGGVRPDDLEDAAPQFVLSRCEPVAFRALQGVPLVRPERYVAHLGLRRPAEYGALRSLMLGVRLAAPTAWDIPRGLGAAAHRRRQPLSLRPCALGLPSGSQLSVRVAWSKLLVSAT